ncbi:hypothetical protein ACJX0J_033821 [Zea mays]
MVQPSFVNGAGIEIVKGSLIILLLVVLWRLVDDYHVSVFNDKKTRKHYRNKTPKNSSRNYILHKKSEGRFLSVVLILILLKMRIFLLSKCIFFPYCKIPSAQY